MYIFQTTLPLSAAVFRGLKTLMPNCPPRLDVQVLKRSHWSRVPNTCVQVSTLKLSDIRGWSMICEDPGVCVCVGCWIFVCVGVSKSMCGWAGGHAFARACMCFTSLIILILLAE